MFEQSRKSKRLLTALTCAACLQGTAVQAQSGESPKKVRVIEEIIVSAQKRD